MHMLLPFGETNALHLLNSYGWVEPPAGQREGDRSPKVSHTPAFQDWPLGPGWPPNPVQRDRKIAGFHGATQPLMI